MEEVNGVQPQDTKTSKHACIGTLRRAWLGRGHVTKDHTHLDGLYTCLLLSLLISCVYSCHVARLRAYLPSFYISVGMGSFV